MGGERELEAAVAALRDRGIAPERTVESGYKTSVFLIDPDGLRVEFYALRSGSLPDLSAVAEGDRDFAV
jgi:hypothetical protein